MHLLLLKLAYSTCKREKKVSFSFFFRISCKNLKPSANFCCFFFNTTPLFLRQKCNKIEYRSSFQKHFHLLKNKKLVILNQFLKSKLKIWFSSSRKPNKSGMKIKKKKKKTLLKEHVFPYYFATFFFSSSFLFFFYEDLCGSVLGFKFLLSLLNCHMIEIDTRRIIFQHLLTVDFLRINLLTLLILKSNLQINLFCFP